MWALPGYALTAIERKRLDFVADAERRSDFRDGLGVMSSHRDGKSLEGGILVGAQYSPRRQFDSGEHKIAWAVSAKSPSTWVSTTPSKPSTVTSRRRTDSR